MEGEMNNLSDLTDIKSELGIVYSDADLLRIAKEANVYGR